MCGGKFIHKSPQIRKRIPDFSSEEILIRTTTVAAHSGYDEVLSFIGDIEKVYMNLTPEAPLTEAVHLKVSAPLYRALKRMAEKQDCSVNSLVMKLLELGARKECEFAATANAVLGDVNSGHADVPAA